MHETVGNVLRTLLYVNPPQNLGQANELIDSALATATHAMRANIHTGLKSSPGTLAFGCDMFLNVPLTADWFLIQQHRQQAVNENLRRQNAR